MEDHIAVVKHSIRLMARPTSIAVDIFGSLVSSQPKPILRGEGVPSCHFTLGRRR